MMMDDSSQLWMLIKSYGPMAPIFLIWIIGIIWAIARWRRHPQVSMLCVLGFGMMIISQFVGAMSWLFFIRTATGANIQETIEGYLLMLRLFNGAITSIGWAMILLAIFGWRANPGGGWGGAFARHEERVTMPDPDRSETR
jgi:hypothetical protein